MNFLFSILNSRGTKSPMSKTLSEEEPSSTTVSKEDLSERSAEVQQGNTAES